jgi:hypothetical protein
MRSTEIYSLALASLHRARLLIETVDRLSYGFCLELLGRRQLCSAPAMATFPRRCTSYTPDDSSRRGDG